MADAIPTPTAKIRKPKKKHMKKVIVGVLELNNDPCKRKVEFTCLLEILVQRCRPEFRLSIVELIVKLCLMRALISKESFVGRLRLMDKFSLC